MTKYFANTWSKNIEIEQFYDQVICKYLVKNFWRLSNFMTNYFTNTQAKIKNWSNFMTKYFTNNLTKSIEAW